MIVLSQEKEKTAGFLTQQYHEASVGNAFSVSQRMANTSATETPFGPASGPCGPPGARSLNPAGGHEETRHGLRATTGRD
jgi:hypothetical protein